MATKTKRKKPACVDGTRAHHMLFGTPEGGMVAGECKRGCGFREVVNETPEQIRKLQGYGR